MEKGKRDTRDKKREGEMGKRYERRGRDEARDKEKEKYDIK